MADISEMYFCSSALRLLHLYEIVENDLKFIDCKLE